MNICEGGDQFDPWCGVSPLTPRAKSPQSAVHLQSVSSLKDDNGDEPFVGDSLLHLRENLGDLFEDPNVTDDSPSTGARADYESLEVRLNRDYCSMAAPRVLRSLVRKAISIYQHTAPHSSEVAADALCRLSLEWWLINAALDRKCEIKAPLDLCHQLLPENSMMFWDESYVPSLGGALYLLQRGFCATAKLCWGNDSYSKTYIQMIASELMRYMFSRNIGVRQRIHTFSSVQEALSARRSDGGMVAQVLLTELSTRPFRISDETRRSKIFLKTLERLSIVTTLLNDIASICDDHRSGSLSVVLFLYEQRSVHVRPEIAMMEALERTCEQLRSEHQAFYESLKELERESHDPPAELSRYSNYLKMFLRRYWNWQMSCSSYFDPCHPVVEFRQDPRRISTM